MSTAAFTCPRCGSTYTTGTGHMDCPGWRRGTLPVEIRVCDLEASVRGAIEEIDSITVDPARFARDAGMALPLIRGGLSAGLHGATTYTMPNPAIAWRAAQVDADDRAALSALRSRFPTGPLAERVTGLLAVGEASRVLREAEMALEAELREWRGHESFEARQKARAAEDAARAAWRSDIDARAANEEAKK